MWEGFRNFLMRGNVVELATAVVIGGAFTKIVDGFMKSIVEPLLSLLVPGGATKGVEALAIGPFPIGILLAAIISFLMTAAVVYFFLIRPLTNMAARFAPPPAPPAPTPEDVVLLREIRDSLKARA